ncbi:MAG: ComEC/Rec2 family competence protein, partial [Kiritimatiellae bacterium]|nr:ComEC/Rec2 family competence protein [Kiritimatiellia bacterium]
METWTFEEEWTEARGPERRRRPLGWMSLAVLAGTAIGVSVDFPAGWVLAGALAAVGGLFAVVGKRWTGWAMLAVLVAMSAVHARQETREAEDTELGRVLRRDGEYAAFEAVALEDAAWRAAGAHRASAGIFRARLERVNRKGTWERCGGEIRVNLHGAEAGGRMPRYGERWRMSGVMRAGRAYRSGLFGMERNEAVVDPGKAECVAEGAGNAFRAWCWGRRRACRAALSRGLEGRDEAAGVLQALILGYREDLPEGLRADFSATGTIHIFAISGAHVGMVCMLLNLALRALMVPKTRRFWIQAPLLAVYVTMTGMATSAVRAAVMAGCFSLAPALRRRSDPLTALGLASTVILLASPGQVADVGFLMSFSAVWGILTMMPPLERLASRLWRRDPWKLAPHEEDGQGGPPLWSFPLSGTVMGVSVWVATLPLTLWVFQLFSPVAPAMNVLVIPAALGILTAGVASLAVSWMGAVGAWAGATFNLGGAVVAEALTGVIRWTAGLPWGHAYAPPPPWWGVVAWMAAIGWGG